MLDPRRAMRRNATQENMTRTRFTTYSRRAFASLKRWADAPQLLLLATRDDESFSTPCDAENGIRTRVSPCTPADRQLENAGADKNSYRDGGHAGRDAPQLLLTGEKG